jgi:hypothetical protein
MQACELDGCYRRLSCSYSTKSYQCSELQKYCCVVMVTKQNISTTGRFNTVLPHAGFPYVEQVIKASFNYVYSTAWIIKCQVGVTV